MDTVVLLATVLGAAAVGLLTFGIFSMATAERDRVAMRVSRTGIGVRHIQGPATDVRVHGRASNFFAPIDRALVRYSWAGRSRLELDQADLALHISEFVIMRALGTLAMFAIIALIGGFQLLFILFGLIAAAVAYWQFGAFVRRRISRRRNAIDAQLDQALVSIAGSVRAGFSFLQACQLSVNQMQWPLKQEFEAMLEEVSVGASIDDALRNLSEKVESYEVDIAVNAVLVQRQVGGSLSEILDNVAHTIRERRELRGHLMALTAQQRLSAIFVASVPIGMAVLLSLTSWQFMKPLYLTLTGNILLSVGIIMDILGFLVMRRMTRIDF
jgi:tight adherence protein B